MIRALVCWIVTKVHSSWTFPPVVTLTTFCGAFTVINSTQPGKPNKAYYAKLKQPNTNHKD